ncbi:MAG: hypothetical protein LBS16_06655 [Prevotellaceae bacterium]|jgi:hypothetical protein|nr:hypothetical protein [Prevotellaceae bacterium]
MQKRSFYLSLILVAVFFACGSKASTNDNVSDTDTTLSAISEQNNNCIIDENKIFNDTTWFLPYVNVAKRDALRAVFEQWKFQLPVDEGFDEGCEITLTLYKDSTYMYNSPCEWVADTLTGTYFYCNDTLYCVEIGIGSIEDSNGLPKVQCINQFIKNKNKLKYLFGKQQIFKGKMRVVKAPNELVFEKQN